ncbi:MAG: hypothetical protein IPF81_14645 [Bacteroidetes bacterium]|nr:hypothetical protein [Bacteroidota bacterium]
MQQLNSLLAKFIKEYPDLMLHSPVIDIYEPLDNEGKPTGKINIDVKHPFVFNIRRIPKTFKGIEVKDITVGKVPKEFAGSNLALPWFEIFSPENYVRFVDKNIKAICERLKEPKWSKTEVLDALTGGFRKYELKCKKAKREMLVAHVDEVAFFKQLLKDTQAVFIKSDVQKQYGQGWGYSVLATSIFKGTPLIVGFNWGAAKGTTYEKQSDYPLRMFQSNYNDLGSLKRTVHFFEEYYPDALHGMQTNYCFFRTEKESQISQADLDSCRDLFFRLVEYAEPSSIISFSSKLRDHLLGNKLIDNDRSKEVDSKGKKFSAIKGRMRMGTKKDIPFFYLPHPMAKVSGDARKRLWEFCFTNMD